MTVAIGLPGPVGPLDAVGQLMNNSSALTASASVVGGALDEFRQAVQQRYTGPSADPSQPLGGNVVGTTKNPALSSRFLAAASVPVPSGGDGRAAWEKMASQLAGLYGQAATGSAVSGAQLNALWQGTLDQTLALWQAVQPQVYAAIAARRTLETRVAALQSQVPADCAPTPPPAVPPTPARDGLEWASNFFAGWADTLTLGITQKIRQGLGYDDVVDKSSSAYGVGTLVGTIHNQLLGAFGAGAAGWAKTGLDALNTVNMVGGALDGVKALADGDLLGAAQALGAWRCRVYAGRTCAAWARRRTGASGPCAACRRRAA